MDIKRLPIDNISQLKKKPPATIRVNTRRITKDELMNKLMRKGFELSEHPLHEQAIKVIKQPFSIGATTEYLAGYYIVQDSASILAASELKPEPGELVLDMTAGPGGKTTHLSQLMNNKGVIIACDSNKKRLASVKYNSERMGCTNIMGLNIEAQKVKELGLTFDKILLDAPCSSLGTLYKNPQLLKKELPLKRLKKIQIELIESAIKVLKPKGALLYSTCTVTLEENEEVVKHALSQGMTIDSLSTNKGVKGFGLPEARRYYPNLHESQGFFIARMVKA